ncbi:MAG: Asp-tRNA(Asn)/Glu-tRNA(Gln) amidotransferase subunit GatC [Nitrospinae bacterium]|nr:Asp-tRNA(Asn)/Glu-tRNA(Gln) amidotransferase subunit GatC [Nitrospinota bacterium]
MQINEGVIKKTAGLARLRVNDEEIKNLKKDLSDILSHIEALSEVNTDGIEPTASTISQQNVFREDKVEKRFENEDLLNLSPKTGHGHFMVPKVI